MCGCNTIAAFQYNNNARERNLGQRLNIAVRTGSYKKYMIKHEFF